MKRVTEIPQNFDSFLNCNLFQISASKRGQKHFTSKWKQQLSYSLLQYLNQENEHILLTLTSVPLTDNSVPLVELGRISKATVGMQVCKACQPQSSMCMCERESDAMRPGLWDLRPSFGIHGVWRLGGAVHPGGSEGVLVVVSGNLWEHKEEDIIFTIRALCAYSRWAEPYFRKGNIHAWNWAQLSPVIKGERQHGGERAGCLCSVRIRD